MYLNVLVACLFEQGSYFLDFVCLLHMGLAESVILPSIFFKEAYLHVYELLLCFIEVFPKIDHVIKAFAVGVVAQDILELVA